jgi:methionyl aminopeptidase
MIGIGKWTEEINCDLTPKVVYNYDETLDAMTNFDDSKSVSYIRDLRQAADCHRIVRKHIQDVIKPGMKILDICNLIENKITEVCGKNDLTAGIAFPTGLSLNNVIAHDSANPNDDRIFKESDVCKVDYGCHINGYIIDSAFTMTFDNKYENLLESTKDATWSAIKMAGPDAICNEISKEIKEVIESYEVELDGKTYQLKAVDDLGGHNISKYNIHAGKLVLCGPTDHPIYTQMRMQAGEQFAIETFASTGTGKYKQGEVINHYSINQNAPKINYKFSTTKDVHKWITNNRSSLPFSNKWLHDDATIGKKCSIGLKELLDKKIVTGYPPLYDIKGSFSSQSEHTIYLHENGKEVLSLGEDY